MMVKEVLAIQRCRISALPLAPLAAPPAGRTAKLTNVLSLRTPSKMLTSFRPSAD